MTDEIGTHLRNLLDSEQDVDRASLERVRGRVNAIVRQNPAPNRDAPQKRARRRSQRTSRIIAFAVIGAILLGTVAVAADMGILFSDKPTTDRIKVLRPDAPDTARIPDALRGEYTILDWPVPAQVGVPQSDDQSRILIAYKDDHEDFQLVAVPTDKGHLCYGITAAGDRKSDAQENLTCGGFRSGWPLIESARGFNASLRYYFGIAADEVVNVRFIADDHTFDATMGTNAYVWVPPSGIRASAIEVEFADGSIARRNMNTDMGNDPYQQPRMIRPATK